FNRGGTGEFEVHGGLPFETRSLAEAEQSGESVEETAGTGSERRIDSSGEHAANRFQFVGREVREWGWIALLEQVVAEDFVEQTERTAAGLLHGGIAARETEGAKMSDPFEGVFVDQKEFTAPNGSVRAEARAVPRNTQHRSIEFVVRHARKHMGVVVLETDALSRRHVLGEFGGEIFGMEIAGDDLRLTFVQPGQIGGGFLECGKSLDGFQIADVLAHKCLA